MRSQNYDSPINTIKNNNNTAYSMNTGADQPSGNDNSDIQTGAKLNLMKILNINFQGIKNKVADLHALLDAEKPDILIATETWLKQGVKTCELFPSTLFIVKIILMGTVVCLLQSEIYPPSILKI